MQEIREGRIEDLAVGDDAAALPEDGGVEKHLLADHGIVLVVGVVGITELAVGPELELQELVPELPLMPHVVPKVELSVVLSCRHLRRRFGLQTVKKKGDEGKKAESRNRKRKKCVQKTLKNNDSIQK